MPSPADGKPPAKGTILGRSTELLRYSSLGLEMGVAIVIGLLFGMWLDRVFGTKPWLTVIFLGFGIVAGFKNLVALARKESRKKDDGSDEPP